MMLRRCKTVVHASIDIGHMHDNLAMTWQLCDLICHMIGFEEPAGVDETLSSTS